MNGFIEKLSIRVAESTSRRDFISLLLRWLAGAGMGVLYLGGAEAMEFVGGTCNVVQWSGCEGDQHCWNGDSMGCNIAGSHRTPHGVSQPSVPGADVPACITCNCNNRNPCVGSTPNVKKWWTCCCNFQLTICVDCQSPGWPSGPLTPRKCICECYGGSCSSYYGVDTCRQGYVWREAVRGDHVCVPPQTRSQAQVDNQHAAERRAGGGPFGPDTCKTGFVWREAVPNDHVCVTPQTRSQTRFDNGQAASRRRPQRHGNAIQ
jgi:hypothetical protein